MCVTLVIYQESLSIASLSERVILHQRDIRGDLQFGLHYPVEIHKTKIYCDLHILPLILTYLKRLNCQRNKIHTPQRSIQPQQNFKMIKLRGWVQNEWEILIHLE